MPGREAAPLLPEVTSANTSRLCTPKDEERVELKFRVFGGADTGVAEKPHPPRLSRKPHLARLRRTVRRDDFSSQHRTAESRGRTFSRADPVGCLEKL